MFIISLWFPWIQGPGTAQLDSPLRPHGAVIKVSTGAAALLWASLPVSKLIQFGGRIQFLEVVS